METARYVDARKYLQRPTSRVSGLCTSIDVSAGKDAGTGFVV